jgi:hypothetical protein
MTSTPTWHIANMDRTLPDGTVTTLHWTVSLSDDAGHTAGAYGSIGLPAPDPDAFTPFDELTEAEVINQWLLPLMGAEQVAAYASALEAQIAEQINPTRGSGLPWTATPLSMEEAMSAEQDEAAPPSEDEAAPPSDAA